MRPGSWSYGVAAGLILFVITGVGVIGVLHGLHVAPHRWAGVLFFWFVLCQALGQWKSRQPL
jgi:hypothetical protein